MTTQDNFATGNRHTGLKVTALVALLAVAVGLKVFDRDDSPPRYGASERYDTAELREKAAGLVISAGHWCDAPTKLVAGKMTATGTNLR